MKRDNVNYVLVGVAVLVAFGLLLATLFIITGRTGAATRYHVHYANVTGLGYGAPVFYQGFRIGQVTDIEPQRTAEGTRYRVQLSVRADWPIPRDSVAQLVSSGLLADVSVGIREGVSKDVIPAGGEIAGAESADVFAALNTLAGELTLLTRQRVAPLVDTLSMRLESLSGTLDEGAPELVAESKLLLGRLNAAADNLNNVLGPHNQQAVAGILADVRGVTLEMRRTQERLDGVLDGLKGAVDENRPELRQTMLDLERSVGAIAQRIDSVAHHLESASRNLDEFAREIRRSPNRLLFTPPADQVEE